MYINEYNEMVRLSKDKIKYLSLIGVDSTRYSNRLDKLVSDIDKKYLEISSSYQSPLLELMRENLYKNALMRLKIIECEYIEYNEYLDSCILIEKISNIINNNELNESSLNDIVDRVINILKSNNNFDIETLNNIYSMCYKLMQLEIEYNSKSNILVYSKDNIKLKNYIKNRLKEEIVSNDKVLSSECDIAFECSNNLGDKLINEENISEVTNDDIKEEVMSELRGFLKQINKNEKEIEKIPVKKTKHNPVTVTIVTYASILAVASSVVGLACKNSISHEYLTDKVSITSGKVTEDEKYMPKIKNGYQELVLETYPWIDLGNGSALKKEISYDVTESDINKDNYESADLSSYKKTITERKASDRIFDINIGENVKRSFVTLKQDYNDEKTRFDGLTFYIYMFLGSLSGIFTLLLAGGLYEAVTHEYIKDLTREAYRRIKNGEVSKEETEICEKYTQKYLKLIEENEEIKKRFMEKYNKYCDLIDIEELRSEYSRIMK